MWTPSSRHTRDTPRARLSVNTSISPARMRIPIRHCAQTTAPDSLCLSLSSLSFLSRVKSVKTGKLAHAMADGVVRSRRHSQDTEDANTTAGRQGRRAPASRTCSQAISATCSQAVSTTCSQAISAEHPVSMRAMRCGSFLPELISARSRRGLGPSRREWRLARGSGGM